MSDKLKSISEQLKQFVFIKEMWLFGSYAYGVPNNDSDIDLCVVIEDGTFSNDNYGEIRLVISQAVGFGYDVDRVILEISRVAELKERKDLVFYDVFNKGQRIY